ncbi:hypothetical protein HPB48_005727 [Haemaphysalis longicornis]|uniref:Uncharacterized protein n=1 Tax=Haemaphysalis longicornis TaxID=44386 RepID=A0A9J6FBV3_HAELO|nr:hypothetical protein HPB48_005727 [Haemaphysalis longicornis]
MHRKAQNPKRLLHSHSKWNATGDTREKQPWAHAARQPAGGASAHPTLEGASPDWAALHTEPARPLLTGEGAYHTANNTVEDTQSLGVPGMRSGQSIFGSRDGENTEPLLACAGQRKGRPGRSESACRFIVQSAVRRRRP